MDGQVTQIITLDFSRPAVPDVVTYTQYSKVLPTIEAELYTGGVPYTIPNNATVNLRIKKPTGHVVYAPATSVAGNVVTYQLAAQAAAAAGMGTACIEIGTANGVLQSPVFALKIVANPMQDDAVKDTDDYKTVAEAVAAANLVNQNLDAILAAPDYAAQAKQSETQAGTYKDAAAQSAEAAADSAADAKSSAAALSSAAILTYTHRRSEGVHMLTPPAGKTAYTNAIIRFVAAADFTAGDVFYIGTTTLRGTYANGEALDTGAFVTGETVLVCRNDKKLTFKGSGGLSGADLALADAAAADVLESKTFYSGGDKLLKTGDILIRNQVGKNGTVGLSQFLPGVAVSRANSNNTQTNNNLDKVSRLCFQPPAGFYNGNTYVGETFAKVSSAIGLNEGNLCAGSSVLDVTGRGHAVAMFATIGENRWSGGSPNRLKLTYTVGGTSGFDGWGCWLPAGTYRVCGAIDGLKGCYIADAGNLATRIYSAEREYKCSTWGGQGTFTLDGNQWVSVTSGSTSYSEDAGVCIYRV